MYKEVKMIYCDKHKENINSHSCDMLRRSDWYIVTYLSAFSE